MGRHTAGAATCCLVALLGLVGTVHAKAPSGRVLWVEGTVTAKTLGEGKAQAMALQATDFLPDKARLTVARGGALWFIRHGRTAIGLRGPGTWELHPTKAVAGDGRTTTISLATLGLDGESLVPWTERERSVDGEPELTPMSPVETAVMTRRPVLRWQMLPTVHRVDLTVSRRDDDGSLHPVERWRGLTSTRHEISRPLEPGHDYRWELRIGDRDLTGDLDPLRDQQIIWFHVLSEAAVRAIRGADATISRYQLKHPEAVKALEVVRALMWEHHGLTAEARAGWDDICAQTGDVEALRLYRSRLDLRVLAAPRMVRRPAPVVEIGPSAPDVP